MKNIAGIIIRLACIAALFAAASCAQEARQDSVRMSDTAIVLEDGELSYQFEVVANAAWTLTCVDEDGNNPDWFSVTPSSGNGTTKVTLNIISTNPDIAIRTGKIVAVCGDKSSEATVTQRGVSRVISFIDPQVVAISSASATSGRFTLVLSSKGATVTAKLPSDASWLSNLNLIEDVETGFSARKTWSFDVAPNNMSDMRSAVVEVTVSAKGKTDRYSVRVEQSGQGVPAIKTPDVVYMGSNQSTHTQPFWVDGSKENLTYQISFSSASMDTGEPWIKDATVVGDNLVITAEPNTFSESREGSVYIVGTRASAAGSGASTALSVKVYQAGHTSAGIQMAASEVSVGYAAASHFVSFVLLNGSKVSGKPEANVSWITDVKATDEGRLTYSVSEYNAASDESDYREGIISFMVGNGASNPALASLKVRQYSSRFTDIVLPSELSLQAKSASATIPFNADGGTLEVVDNGIDWLDAECVASGGLSVIKVTASDWTAGEAGSPLRSGLVTLKYSRNGRSVYHYVNVYQYAPAVLDITVPAAFNLDYDDEKVVFKLGLRGGRIGEIGCSSSGDWIRSAAVSGTGDIAEITVKVDKWTTATAEASSRSGMLCIPYTYDGLTMYHYVQINQRSQVFTDIVLPSGISLQAKSASATIPFDAAGGKLEVVDNGGDWLAATSGEQGGLTFVKLAASDWAAGDADTPQRSALVTLKYTRDGMSAYHYVTVTQTAPVVRDITVPAALNLDYDDEKVVFELGLRGGRIGDIGCTSSGDWIRSAVVRGTGDIAEITVKVDKWTAATAETSSRSGLLCIPYTNDGLTMYYYVQVNQKSQAFRDIFLPAGVNLQAKSASTVIPFDAASGKLEVVDNGGDWVNAACTENGGLSVINVTATDWTAGEADTPLRTTVVTLKYTKNGMSVYHYVNVSQYAPAAHDISMPEAMNLDFDEVSAKIVVGLRGGRIGEIMCTSAGDWIRSASVKENGDIAEIAVSVDKWATATAGASNRAGSLCIPYIYDGLTMYHYVQVNQKSQAFKDIVLPDEVSLPAKWAYELVPYELDGGTLEVIKSTASGSWLNVSNMIIGSDTFLIVSADDWQASDAASDLRSGLAAVKYTWNGMSAYHYVTVKQFAPKVRDIAVPSAVSLNYDETSTSFAVALNGGEIGSIECYSAGGWIRSAKVRKNGANAEIVIEADRWNGSVAATSDRTGIICVPYIYDGMTMYHYVQVSQKPEQFADIAVPSIITLRNSGASTSFYLDSSKGNVSGATSSAGWLSVACASQNGLCTVELRADDYTDAAPFRTGLVSITYQVNSITVTYNVTVVQYNQALSALMLPPVITVPYNQTSADVMMTLDPAAATGSTVGRPEWASEDGWLTNVAESSLKLSLAFKKWEDNDTDAIFRQGAIAVPYAREGVGAVYHFSTVYQYSNKMVGIDIPSSVYLKAAELKRTIPVEGDKGGKLTAEYDAVSAPWIEDISISSDNIVIAVLPGTLSVAGETSRSAIVTFTYSYNGISTVYNMTVTQELADASISLKTLNVYRHYRWWERDERDREQVDYTSFQWLSKGTVGVNIEGSAIGLPISYNFEAENTDVKCSDPSLFGSIKVADCSLCGDHFEFALTFSDPNLSNWRKDAEYFLTFNVGDGKTLECPLDLEVFEHKPDRVAGLQDIVPDVGDPANGSEYRTKAVNFSDLATPEGEKYIRMNALGVFADKECTMPQPSTAVTSLNTTVSDASSGSIHMAFRSLHPHEEGYVGVDLITESGKQEMISIPYRLYSDLARKGTLPPSNKVAFNLDELVDNADDWVFDELYAPSSSDYGSVVMVGDRVVVGWNSLNAPSSIQFKLGFRLKSNPYGDESKVSKMTVSLGLVYNRAPVLLEGEFSIAANRKVRFTRSNLVVEFQSSEKVFRFNDSQLTPPILSGSGNMHNDVSAGERRDLFGWSTDETDFGTLRLTYPNRYSGGTFYDWGNNTKYYCPDIAGKGYRTLSYQEWDYVLNRRTVQVNLNGEVRLRNGVVRCAFCGQAGLLLLPDTFVWDEQAMGAYLEPGALSPNMTASQFAAYEYAGAVWLPTAGHVYTDRVSMFISISFTLRRDTWLYWTSTYANVDKALAIEDQNTREFNKWDRASVRLVKDI